MSRYINADKLIDEIIFSEEDVGIIGSKEVIDIIQNMPSADVVEVVRCKDCKYSSYDDSYLSIPICEKLGIYADNDFFCSYGERKETE